MHIRHPAAEEDHIHQITAGLVRVKGCNVRTHIWRAAWVLEFAFLSRWLDAKGIRKAMKLSQEKGGKAFAEFCWRGHMIPISPRHGQGTQKALHSRLKKYAAAGDQRAFRKEIEAYFKSRVLTTRECRTLAEIVSDTSVNRIKAINDALANKNGYGDFAAKNLIEVFCVHRILENVTDAEWASLKNGQGANRFLTQCGISRAEMTTYLKTFFEGLKRNNNLSIKLPGSKMKKVPYNKLGLPISCFTDRLTQYWSCAQGRVLTVHSSFYRRHPRPVPYHLLPNREIMKQITKAFAEGEPGDSDSDSDWEEI